MLFEGFVGELGARLGDVLTDLRQARDIAASCGLAGGGRR